MNDNTELLGGNLFVGSADFNNWVDEAGMDRLREIHDLIEQVEDNLNLLDMGDAISVESLVAPMRELVELRHTPLPERD